MPQNAWIIAALPLLAYILIISFGRRAKESSAYFGIGAMGIAFILAVVNLANVIQGASAHVSARWLTLGDWQIDMGYRVGPLESAMLLMVTLVGLMIELFSKGYMHGDERFPRFFANVNLFIFGMLTLIIADNFILFFMAWEIMGLCSYLLIGHWFEDLDNARAAMKAFLVTRIGDVGLMMGIWLLGASTRTFNIDEIMKQVGGMDPGFAALAALLLFAGAVGKSAQVPLQIWLPDAMAGPTPVSALIHAATMVAAGVFLVGRAYPLFQVNPLATGVVAFTGGITLLMAALIATVQTDIKKTLAYSTISQLGYMMMALGVGGYTAGIFHLETHAFFKALLFLAAGSVIHAAHTQEMHQMGGLLGKLKITGTTFIIGTLALAGIPPFSGFFSKDEILLEAFHSPWPILFWVGVAGAFLTAYYMSRTVILTFFGKPRDHHVYDHAHESPAIMVVPLMVLAVPATIAGFLGAPMHTFEAFILGHKEAEPTEFDPMVMGLSIAAALGGMLLAWVLYGRAMDRTGLIRSLRPLYTLFKEKFYFDHLGLGIAYLGRGIAAFVGVFDRYVVDGLVNLTAWIVLLVGRGVRQLAVGSAQAYAMVMFAALVVGIFLYQFMVLGG